MSVEILTIDGQASMISALVAFIFTPGGATHTNIKLFQNNIVPQFNTVEGDFVEADFVGYGAQNLDAWTSSINQEGNWEAFPSTAPATFTAGALTGPQTIYGYYVKNSSSGLIIAERFDTPITLTLASEYIQVFPRFSFTDILGTGNIND